MKKSVIVYFFLFLTINIIPAYAAETTENEATTSVKERIQKQIETKKTELKATITERACDKVNKTIDAKIGQFDENKNRHVTEYKNMKDRIQKFITKLSDRGFDTTKLKTDLATLDTKIQQFATDYATYIAKLKDAKTLTCGQSSGQFKTAMQSVKAALEVVHQDAMAMHTFYRETIVPDLKAINSANADKRKLTPKPTKEATSSAENQ